MRILISLFVLLPALCFGQTSWFLPPDTAGTLEVAYYDGPTVFSIEAPVWQIQNHDGSGGTITIRPYGKSGQYLEYIPNSEPKGIILFLHGLGECGPDINTLYRHSIPRQLRDGWPCDYIVIMPQLPKGSTSWPKAVLMSIFPILDSYGYDHKIVTGLSLGGMGTFGAVNYAYEYNGNKPGYFAAAGIVCGKTEKTDTASMRPFKGMVVKAWHGTKDTTIPPTRIKQWMPNFIATGGNGELVLWPMSHNVWDKAYGEEFWPWVASLERIEPPTSTVDSVVHQWVGKDGLYNVLFLKTTSGKIYRTTALQE